MQCTLVASNDATLTDRSTNPEATVMCVQLNRCGVSVCFTEGIVW